MKSLREIVYGNKILSAFNRLRIAFRLCFIVEWPSVLCLRIRYRRRLSRIRSTYGHRKLRVIFPVSNVAKWKEQSLYDLMKASDKYEPIVALTVMDIENDLPESDKINRLDENKRFFIGRGCAFVVAYSVSEKKSIPFSEFNADIVWYTQPWRIPVVQDCLESSRTVLCCYTPYYLQNYGCLDMECGITFMRSVWRNFAMNADWAKVCEKYQGFRRAGRSVGLGHTMIDEFYLTRNDDHKKNYVIYAPHWSCDVGECFSTFLLNGKKILKLAQQYPELHWVFKPHPTLRSTLVNSCGWTRNEVDEYYAAWANIGETCYDGNYVDLFNNSRVMITDCGSFLVEYPCTGNPIVHLVSSKSKYETHPISKELFGTYYQAHTWEEFITQFKRVVLNGDDYKKEERLEAVRKMKLMDNYAARNILDYLDGVFKGHKK